MAEYGTQEYALEMERLENGLALDIVNQTKARLGVEGNRYYYIIGSLPEPDCVCGFGDTPMMAAFDFAKKFRYQKTNGKFIFEKDVV